MDKEKIEELINGLHTGNYSVRLEIVERLISCGKEAAPYLIAGLKNEIWMVRQDCSHILGKLHAIEAMEDLARLKEEDAEEGVRVCAAEAIAELEAFSAEEMELQSIAGFLSRSGAFLTDGPLSDELKNIIANEHEAIYENSLCALNGSGFFMKKTESGKRLMIIRPGAGEIEGNFKGVCKKIELDGKEFMSKMCELDHENISVLRKIFVFTNPVPLGIKTSFGMGDRLGIATPGHIRAVRGYEAAPIFAQQSIREMTRTGRSPNDVMDDACAAVFQEGFRLPFGADADHLKTRENVEKCAAAGFTFFTIDPSEHLNLNVDSISIEELSSAYNALFVSSEEKYAFEKRYAGKEFYFTDAELGISARFDFGGLSLKRIAVKYLPALRHTAGLHELLCSLKGAYNFDFEMSIDETSTPTTHEEHLFIAAELKEMGITPQSVAPRYIGEFQKAIDYIGDVQSFRESLKIHYLIAKNMGPYKLSIHSGSDKFSIFPVFGEITRGLFHEKTAGTSYLEAIRVVARRAPDLYRDIHRFALTRFEEDRASYNVTTDLSAIPNVQKVPDSELEHLLDENNCRQLIHITYGSVLTSCDQTGMNFFYNQIMETLKMYEEDHYEFVASHFRRHIESLGIPRTC